MMMGILMMFWRLFNERPVFKVTNVLTEFPAMFLLTVHIISSSFYTKCRSIFSFFLWHFEHSYHIFVDLDFLGEYFFPGLEIFGTFTGVFIISVDFLFNLFISEFSIFGLYLSGSKTQTINTLNLLNVWKLTFNIKQSFEKYRVQGFVQ